MAWSLVGNIAGPQGATVPANGIGNAAASGQVLIPWNLLNATTNTAGSGSLGLYPIDVGPNAITIKALCCNVTTAQVGGTGTLNQAVLYADRGDGCGPLVTTGGLLASVAVAATTTGIKLTALPSNIVLQPGRYWAGLLYYQGSTAPTTVPGYTTTSNTIPLFSLTTSFQISRFLSRSGLSAVPTDGVGFGPNTGTSCPIVGVQLN